MPASTPSQRHPPASKRAASPGRRNHARTRARAHARSSARPALVLQIKATIIIRNTRQPAGGDAPEHESATLACSLSSGVTGRTRNCPQNNAWMNVLLNETSHVSSPTIFFVGCNKGDDFIAHMHDWSGDSTFSVSRYSTTMTRNFLTVSDRSCKLKHAADSYVPRRSVRGFCIEPMPKNFKLIESTMTFLNYSGPVTLIQASISSVPGVDVFPDGDFGVESLGLGHLRIHMFQ